MQSSKSEVRLNVCTITNDGYAAFAAVTLASVFHNHPPGSVNAYVISRTLSDQNHEKLDSVAQTFHDRAIFRDIGTITEYSFAREWTHSYITEDTFYRFFLGEMLEDVSRLLYLDADVIVLRNLDELYSTDTDGKVALAVQTYDEPHWGLSLNARYSLPDTHRYFNAGVLLLDLDAWRVNHIGRQLTDYAQERKVHDEIALNAVLTNRHKLVHPKFNVGPHLAWVGDKFYIPGHYEYPIEAYREAAAGPSVVHFSGPSKPWHYNSIHPFKPEFYKYLSMTPYAGTAPIDANFRNVVLRPAYQVNHLLWRHKALRRTKDLRTEPVHREAQAGR